MKKKLLTIAIASAFALIPSIISSADGGVSVENTFTDETFRSIISTKVDLNQDGSLSEDEINACKKLEIQSVDAIKSVEGIGTLTAIETFSLRYCNNIKLINLSGNNNLKKVVIEFDDKLETIDLGGLYKLESADITHNTSLKSLDFSDLKELTSVTANYNKLKDVKIANNVNLDYIDLSHNRIETVNMNGAPSLKTLVINNNFLIINHEFFQQTY